MGYRTEIGLIMNRTEKIQRILISLLIILSAALPAYAKSSGVIDLELVRMIQEEIKDAPEKRDYHIKAEDLYKWMKLKRDNFVVVDVRTEVDYFKAGHIPGSIFIDYGELFTPENLKKLPKDKKIIVVCEMGASAAMTVIPLRMLGYEAYGLLMGLSSWDKDHPVVKDIQYVIDAPKKRNEPYPVEKAK